MTTSRDNVFIEWSVRVYRLLLHLYPTSFEKEFGGAMAQHFRDQARDGWAGSGLAGVAKLWVGTAVDLVVSVPRLYARETNGLLKVAFGIATLYFLTLFGTLGWAAVRYAEFYEPPPFSRDGAAVVDENALQSAYATALRGEFGEYRLFAGAAGGAVGALLALSAALFALSQRSALRGAIAFGAGTVVTVAALSALPTMWFPLDEYPVAALWVMGVLPFAAAGWVGLMVVGGVMLRKRVVAG